MNNERWCTAVLAGAGGGAVAIAAIEILAERTAVPLAFIPFATSIVMVMGSPDAKPAQPRALIGGHLLSAAVGLVMVTLAGPAAVGRGGGCRARHDRHARRRQLSPARGDQSAADRRQRPPVELLRHSGRRRSRNPRRLHLPLAQCDAPRLMAGEKKSDEAHERVATESQIRRAA
jgi:hypothetical protein